MRSILVPLAISPDLPAPGSILHDAAGSTMGTSWSARVMVAPGRAAGLAGLLQQQLDTVVAQMSHWEPDSVLGRFNRAPAGSWHSLPDEFFAVMEYALMLAEASGGAYDPCAGALVNLWGFGALRRYDQPGFYAPSDMQIGALMAQRGRAQLDSAGRRLLQPGGVQLDLSSVAKGYAVDQLARCLDARGLHHYLVEVGGELRGSGCKPDGQPWWIALEQPLMQALMQPQPLGSGLTFQPLGSGLTFRQNVGMSDLTPGVEMSDLTPPGVAGAAPGVVLALHGLAVATSGDYRRYFQHSAGRASHTLDPRSGYPIRNQVASVTVIHPECMAADALSTALTVLGADDGMRFAEQRQLAARFLLRTADGLEERHSSAYRAMLQ